MLELGSSMKLPQSADQCSATSTNKLYGVYIPRLTDLLRIKKINLFLCQVTFFVRNLVYKTSKLSQNLCKVREYMK